MIASKPGCNSKNIFFNNTSKNCVSLSVHYAPVLRRRGASRWGSMRPAPVLPLPDAVLLQFSSRETILHAG
jgi:hypothetical protein